MCIHTACLYTHEAQAHLEARPRVWAQPKPDPKPAAPIKDWIQCRNVFVFSVHVYLHIERV